MQSLTPTNRQWALKSDMLERTLPHTQQYEAVFTFDPGQWP